MAAQGAADRIGQAGDSVRDAAATAGRKGWHGLQPFLEFQLIDVAGVTLTVGGLIAAALSLLIPLLISALLRRALKRYGQRYPNVDRAALYTVSRLLHYVLLAIGIMVALAVAGLPMSRFAVFAAALSVGLGFGLQAIFSNFVSGLILLFDKSLKVGDFVELDADVRGTVRDINIRATRIITNDNIDILVPNSQFVTGRVVNWTYREVSRRLRIPFGVAYGTDKELVKKAALEAATEVPFTLDLDGARKPQVWLVEFGASSLNFELVVWLNAEATKRPSTVKAAYTWALHTALCKYAIEVPFPQQDLHIRSLFGRHGDDALAAWRGCDEGDGHVCDPPAAVLDVSERAALSDNDAERDIRREIADAAISAIHTDPAARE